MERRKFVVGLGALAVGSSAAVGTGAVSQMTSGDRDVNIEVANDADAYIAIEPSDNTENNGHFARFDGKKLELDFTDDNATGVGGEGVNAQSTYHFDNVFRIRNQGPGGDHYAWVEEDIDGVEFYHYSGFVPDGGSEVLPSELRGSSVSPDTLPEADAQNADLVDASEVARELSAGQSVGIGVKIEAAALSSDSVRDSITINSASVHRSLESNWESDD